MAPQPSGRQREVFAQRGVLAVTIWPHSLPPAPSLQGYRGAKRDRWWNVGRAAWARRGEGGRARV